MKISSDLSNLNLGVSLGEAVLSLDDEMLDEKINDLAGQLFSGLNLTYVRSQLPVADSDDVLYCPVSAEAFYMLSAKRGQYTEGDIQKLHVLVALTARLFATRSRLESEREKSLQQHMLQTQILDQIHESVITMDLAGFILSWNRGAEKLFGYLATEVIGKNILFLYEQEDAAEDPFRSVESFLNQSGREMEIRRRNKNGDIFWARLTLSLLTDKTGTPVGMVGYLVDITQRKLTEEKLNHLAYFDSLTNLPNRNLFKQLVDQVLQQSQRKQCSCALLFIDLNRFKPVNDTFGHQVGDGLLVQVANRFKASLREEDIVSRLGSDEFAVALCNIGQQDHAHLVAQKLLHSLEMPFHVDGNELQLGASIGISIYPEDGNDANELLQYADIAMCKAKGHVTNVTGSYAFYNQNMNVHIASRLYLESGLRKALERQEFFLLYQPKIDIRNKRLESVEALIRWRHPERGLVSPVEFISIAEETGFILQLDTWVLETACQQAKCWQDSGIATFRIAVNVSAKEFTSQLPRRIEDVLTKYQILPGWLEIEITESMLMHSTESVIAIMDQIVRLGVSLALDDFGTGYSSLSYLKRFPISSLKIDRSFVQGIPIDANDCAIASAMIVMAHQLKLKVVAEGVETQAQLEFLLSTGCDGAQGFLFARPVEADQILLFLEHGFN
jgi:diguanylate cyclase (GGDEF)-like protein/PAS domain S-box-containing protein